jgi:hypothetical protein
MKAVPVLRELLSDTSTDVRECAQSALNAITR